MHTSSDRFLRCAQSEHRAFRAHGFGAEIDAEELVYLIEAKVERLVRHPMYERVVKRSKKFHAHDEHNQCQIGDVVRIIETRPLSKTKCWRLLEVVRRHARADVPLAGREELRV